MTRERISLALISLVLIGELLWRLFFPAQESTGTAVSVMGLVFDCGMMIALVGISFQILKSTARPIDAVGPWMALPALGLLAGLGLFVFRLNGELRSDQPPHPQASVSPASSLFPADLEQLATRLGQVFTAYQKAEAELLEARWVNTPAEERQKLPRETLQEFVQRQLALVKALDRILEQLSEPGLTGNIDRLLKITEARGIDVGMGPGQRPDLDPDGWRLLRRMAAAGHQVNALTEANWDEWQALTFPLEGEQKPWLREALALESELQATRSEYDALIAKRTNTPVAPTASPTPDNQEASKFAARLKALHVTCEELEDKLKATRWAQTVRADAEEGYRVYPYATVPLSAIPKLRKLRREDLSEFRKAQRGLLDSIDQGLRLFEEAESRGLKGFGNGPAAKPAWPPVDGPGPERERWRANQRVYTLAYEQSALIEANWEDWRRHGPEPKGKPKPWQEKARQLRRDFVAALNAHQDL